MSDDAGKARKRKRRSRRSLRVPVDEVPRPTEAPLSLEGPAEAQEELARAAAAMDDGGATVEIPAFDDARHTLETIDPAALDSELLGAPRAGASDALEGEPTVAQELPSEDDLEDHPTLVHPSDRPPADDPSVELTIEPGSLEVELDLAASAETALPPEDDFDPPTLVQAESAPVEPAPRPSEPPSPTHPDATELEAPAFHSDELAVDGTPDEEPNDAVAFDRAPDKARDTSPESIPAPAPTSEPPPAEPAPRPAPVVQVVVSRVVNVIGTGAPPQPPPEPAPLDDEDDEPELDVLEVDVDADADEDDDVILEATEGDEDDEVLIEADDEISEDDLGAGELDEAVLDEAVLDEAVLDEAVLEEDRNEASPASHDLGASDLETSDLETAELDPEELDGGLLERASKPPPPPGKPAAPPPPPDRAAEAPATLDRSKKPKRNWWEHLFNDDYLRTVPIPHPRVVQRQCDFIEQRFGLPRGATLLDVGCGLGVHAVELTRRGYLVVGLDLSLPMLSRAADEAQEHGFKINFLHADMREMNFEGAFDAVLCWGTTFGYFDDDTNRLVVERLHQALKPGGLLLLDVVNRDYVVASQPNLVWFEGDGCVVMEETNVNYITSRLRVKRNVILDDGRQRDTRYTVRLYSLHELGLLLHQQGFRVVEVSGREAHPGVHFGADSPRLIILAQRRAAAMPRPSVSKLPAVPSERPSPPSAPPDPDPVAAAEPSDEPPSEETSAALAVALEQSEGLESEPEVEDIDEVELDPDE